MADLTPDEVKAFIEAHPELLKVHTGKVQEEAIMAQIPEMPGIDEAPAPAAPSTEAPSAKPVPIGDPIHDRYLAIDNLEFSARMLSQLALSIKPQAADAEGKPDLAVNAPLVKILLDGTLASFKTLTGAMNHIKEAIG